MNYYVYDSRNEFQFDTYDLSRALESAQEIGGNVTDEYKRGAVKRGANERIYG